MKGIFAVSVVSVVLLVLVACGGGATSAVSVESLMPDDANLIAQIQVGKLVNDPDLQDLYNQTPKDGDAPESFDEALQLALKETGIDVRLFNNATLFADVARQGDYVGVIADGTFDQSALVAAIEEKSGAALTRLSYKDHEILFDDSGADDVALTFLDSQSLAAGTLEAVKAVVDVRAGDRAAVSGPVRDTFDSLGDALIRVAVQIPPETINDLSGDLQQGFGGMPVGVAVFQDLDVVGFVADKDGDMLRMNAQLDFVSADSAAEAGKMLDGFLSLMGAFSSDPEVAALLQKLEVNVEGAKLAVSFEARLSELKDLADSLGGVAQAIP